MNPSQAALIEAVLTGNLADVVARFCDGQWDRLPALWDVPFEDLIQEAKQLGLENFVVTAPLGEGYWLSKTAEGFEVFYAERGVRSWVTKFAELEPAFRHWLRCHLETYRIKV